DAFDRQHRALLELCRYCTRIVSVEEALLVIKQRGLYSPPWQNSDRNTRRIKYHLDYIARTFRPCSKDPDVDWQKFACFFKGAGEQWWLHYTETGKKIKRLLRPEHKAVFLAAMDFCLEHQDRGDNSVPRSRLLRLINDYSSLAVDNWLLTCLFEWAVEMK